MQRDEPAHPAEANDAAICADVDAMIGQNPEPPAEELGNALMIAPQGKVAAKARKKQTKTLKNARSVTTAHRLSKRNMGDSTQRHSAICQ